MADRLRARRICPMRTSDGWSWRRHGELHRMRALRSSALKRRMPMRVQSVLLESFGPPKPKDNEEEKKPTTIEDINLPKYRDRAKERREDQNPDYELMAAASGISSLHAVAPPGAVDLQSSDVEHTHLVKGLDYALLNKVRSEIDKKPEEFEQQAEEEIRVPIKFNSPAARVVYKWLVKPPTSSKTNDMFLPGMAFAFDMEEMTHHIPTIVYRSKDDCPTPEEFVTVGVDMVVLDRISKIMAYLKLGASSKLKSLRVSLFPRPQRKREETNPTRTVKEEAAAPPVDVKQPAMSDGDEAKDIDTSTVEEEAPKARVVEDDIFADAGTEYVAPAQGPAMPQCGSEWQYYLPSTPDDPSYEYYANQLSVEGNASVPAAAIAPAPAKDPRFMTQEEKDRGMSSVFWHLSRPRQLQLGDLHPQESQCKMEEARGFNNCLDAAAGNNGSIDGCEQHSGSWQCGEDTAMAVDDNQGCHTPKF
ncbi:hypothetical protein SELMODRAFT_424142 [Selaginella moellendorffii]|uniref:RED-like N-terminal domain-containing protein n=1 Tax=Selaginella moellendorffii TaxID=88036 RepID=D8SNY6_SELML|nr:hypothetical protein SELMODRAFT_424142 [Selaginella moellendorffii]